MKQYTGTQDILQSYFRWTFKESFICPERHRKGLNTILMFLYFREGLKLKKHQKVSLCAGAPQVLVLAPLEGGSVILLETLKLLVLQFQASDLKTVLLQKDTTEIQTWPGSPFSLHIAEDINICLNIRGGEYSTRQQSCSLQHTQPLPLEPQPGRGCPAAPNPLRRELSHVLGCLSHLLCQESTALAN